MTATFAEHEIANLKSRLSSAQRARAKAEEVLAARAAELKQLQIDLAEARAAHAVAEGAATALEVELAKLRAQLGDLYRQEAAGARDSAAQLRAMAERLSGGKWVGGDKNASQPKVLTDAKAVPKAAKPDNLSPGTHPLNVGAASSGTGIAELADRLADLAAQEEARAAHLLQEAGRPE